MAPSIFAEKDFARILSDLNGYGHIFLDRIRAWDWYALIYEYSDHEAYYCPELVKLFYTSIDHASVNFDTSNLGAHTHWGYYYHASSTGRAHICPLQPTS